MFEDFRLTAQQHPYSWGYLGFGGLTNIQIHHQNLVLVGECCGELRTVKMPTQSFTLIISHNIRAGDPVIHFMQGVLVHNIC